MPNRSPAFQFYANEWLGSTKIMLMSPAQEGVYIRLLAVAWNAPDCGLPDDDKQLAVLSRLGEEWFNGGSTALRECFFVKGGRLFNKRLLAEREKQREWRRKSSIGGKRSAELRRKSRLAKADTLGRGGSRVVAKWLQPNGNPSSSSSSSPTLKDKRLNDSSPKPEKAPARAPAPPMEEIRLAWNKMASKVGLPEALVITAKRKAAIRTRWTDKTWRDSWKAAIALIPSRPFLYGDSASGWQVDIDFFLKPDTVVKIMEGKYAGKPRAPGTRQPIAGEDPDKFAKKKPDIVLENP